MFRAFNTLTFEQNYEFRVQQGAGDISENLGLPILRAVSRIFSWSVTSRASVAHSLSSKKYSSLHQQIQSNSRKKSKLKAGRANSTFECLWISEYEEILLVTSTFLLIVIYRYLTNSSWLYVIEWWNRRFWLATRQAHEPKTRWYSRSIG